MSSGPAVRVVGREGLVEVEQRMREQIRLLQDQRAAAMMGEIEELQRDRGVAAERAARLERSLAELKMEGERDRRALLEERLLNSDLKQKLTAANGQIAALLDKLNTVRERREGGEGRGEGEGEEGGGGGSVAGASVKGDGAGVSVVSVARQQGNQLPRNPGASSSASPRRRKSSLPHSLPPSLTPSPKLFTKDTHSPTVIPRRYVLAAVSTRQASTQTPASSVANDDGDTAAVLVQDGVREGVRKGGGEGGEGGEGGGVIPAEVLDALTSAKRDILELQGKKHEVECRLRREEEKTEMEEQNRKKLSKEYESLLSECGVLREGLRAFGRWTRRKLAQAEEDMDIFKVIYSLHGSLSQERESMIELSSRLVEEQRRVARLEKDNRELSSSVAEARDKLQRSEKDVRSLKSIVRLQSPANQQRRASPLHHRHTLAPAQAPHSPHTHNRHKKHSPHTYYTPPPTRTHDATPTI